MDAFWKWMEEKGYGFMSTSSGDGILKYLNEDGAGKELNTPTKQMMMGYMLEYLISNKTNTYLYVEGEIKWTKIDELYDWLVSKLNALKEG